MIAPTLYPLLQVGRTLREGRRQRRLGPDSPLAVRAFRWATPNLRHAVFVIGAPRSGTSLLGSCLGALPEISYHREPAATKAAARCVYEGTWSFPWARFFYRQVCAWLMRVCFEGHLVFADKTPRNCFIVPFMQRAFPGAQFIHIVRDGRDAALSYSQQPWLQASAAASGLREPGGYLFGPFARFWVEPARRSAFETTTDLHRCIWAWRRHVESAQSASQGLPEGQYLEVRYEALVRCPEQVSLRVLDYVGISAPRSRARFIRAAATAHGQSVGGWRKGLDVDQLQIVEEEAGALLRQLGYREAA